MKKRKIGWSGIALGFVTFLMAHEIEVLRWATWFGTVHQAWFLNSGSALVFTLACVFLASGAAAMLNASEQPVRGVTVALGAFAAMTAVLFLKEGGPGTIFPIVIVAGGTFILASSTAGAWLGREVRSAVKGT